MSTKVFQVAKKLGVKYEDILEVCKVAKIKVKGVNTVLTPKQISKISKTLEAQIKSAPKPPTEDRSPPTVVPEEAVEPVVSAETSSTEPQTIPSTSEETSSLEGREEEQVPEKVDPPPTPVAEEERPASGESIASQPEVEETAQEDSPVTTSSPESLPADSTESPSTSTPEVPSDEGDAEEKKRPAKREVYVARPINSPTSRDPRAPAPGRGLQATMTGRKISLEQLKERTVRPQRSPSSRPPRGGGHRGPGGGGGRQSDMGGSFPGNNESFITPNAVPLPPDPTKEQRRRKVGKPDETGEKVKAQRTSRRRQEISHQDLYRSSGSGGRYNSARSRRKMKGRKGAKTIITTPAAHKRIVRVDETISVGELGKVMGVKSAELIKKLMDLGLMVTSTEQIDFETVMLLVGDYNFEAKNVAFDEHNLLSGPAITEEKEVDPDAVMRAPVVTIMGHVDHGKTTLLDRIRAANVAKGEAGGITQHIGAYKVKVADGAVVFLDTPGHAAFSAMRARGASVTDLIVLVVAADDGIMPQTIESINHARAANVPIIVAVNKCDKHGIDPDRIKQELTAYDLVPEEWGGDTMFVNISALRGDGVDSLLESLALQAEVLEFQANPKKPAYGRVVEARIDKGRGTVVTVLVQEGTLNKGDYMVVGQNYGRVRSMTDHLGKVLKSAGPSTPIEIAGLNGVPSAGEEFFLVKNERDAKRIISNREVKAKEATKPISIFPLDPWSVVKKEVQNLIIKADVSGSLEAIKISLESLSTDEVEVKVLSSAVGQISESDVNFAQTTEANIIGFNVAPDNKSKRIAEQARVQVFCYSIIYELIDAVKDMMSGLLSPEVIVEKIGKVEVRAVFNIQKSGSIAGSFVLDGKVNRNSSARVIRDGEQVHEGKISTLRRFKDDVREVSSGYECGISIDGYKNIQEGDILEILEYKEIRRTIDG